jgi:predicted nucleic acid-binding protein
MILVDSRVWIDYFRGAETPQTDRLDDLLTREPLAVGDLMVAEVLQGFARERDFERARRLMTSLTVLDIAGAEVAIEAARNFRRLRAHGATVRKTIDTLIATRCIIDRHSLLFTDRDFEPFVAHLGLVSAMRSG